MTQVLLDGMRLQLGYQVLGADESGNVRPRRPLNLNAPPNLEMLRSGNWLYYFYPRPWEYELHTRLDAPLQQRVRLDAGELLLLRLRGTASGGPWSATSRSSASSPTAGTAAGA